MRERDHVHLHVEARELTVPAGITVAAALMNAGLYLRRSVTGAPRAALCSMGSCQECRMTIDGLPYRRACLTVVQEGMRVQRDA